MSKKKEPDYGLTPNYNSWDTASADKIIENIKDAAKKYSVPQFVTTDYIKVALATGLHPALVGYMGDSCPECGNKTWKEGWHYKACKYHEVKDCPVPGHPECVKANKVEKTTVAGSPEPKNYSKKLRQQVRGFAHQHKMTMHLAYKKLKMEEQGYGPNPYKVDGYVPGSGGPTWPDLKYAPLACASTGKDCCDTSKASGGVITGKASGGVITGTLKTYYPTQNISWTPIEPATTITASSMKVVPTPPQPVVHIMAPNGSSLSLYADTVEVKNDINNSVEVAVKVPYSQFMALSQGPSPSTPSALLLTQKKLAQANARIVELEAELAAKKDLTKHNHVLKKRQQAVVMACEDTVLTVSNKDVTVTVIG